MNTRFAAVGNTVISPWEPVVLGASNSAGEPWGGVESDLEANMLALWAGDEEFPLVFVTLDLLYPGRFVRAAIEEAAYPIPPERITVAASHTHRAPMTDDTKIGLGRPDLEYLEWLADTLSSLVRSVLASERVPVALALGTSLADHSINRRLRKRLVLSRRPRLNKVVIAPNAQGVRDELLTTIVVRPLHGGKPLVVLWNYACHPVAGPTRNAVSGHFPTDVREIVREHFGDSSLPVLFFQGFSGNTRPSASGSKKSLKVRVRQLLAGPMFDRMTAKTYGRWAGSLAEVLLEAIRNVELIDSPQTTARRLSIPGSTFMDASQPLDDVHVSRIDLDSQVSFVVVSAEVMAEYAPLVRQMLHDRQVVCVGCADHVVGYIPTQKIMSEGGYEADGFCKPFDLNRVNPGAPSALLDAFEGLV